MLCTLTGISERVADIKTRTHAMKCLTAFSEAIGPGFVFERVSSVVILPSRRNCVNNFILDVFFFFLMHRCLNLYL